MKTGAIIIISILVGIGLGYFIYPEKIEYKPIISKFDKAEEVCLEKGGVPIFSLWDNRMKKCDLE